MIALEGVSCRFEGPRGPVHAVQDLTLSIARGETIALLGPSGCGKTSTLRLINRLIEPSSGRVSVEGIDNATVDPVQLRRRMGYVIQSGGLFPHLTVGENVGLLCGLAGWTRARVTHRVNELLQLVRLSPDAMTGRYPAELSGGQRQRVGIARALALDPEILLLDEPFGALDPITRRRLQDEFHDLERLVAKTVVLVSHDLDEAFRLADRIAVLREGRLVQIGPPDALRQQPADDWVRRFVEAGASPDPAPHRPGVH